MNKKSEYVILYKNRDPYKAGPWKEEEDKKLTAGVKKYGESNWVDISSEVYTRSSSQCLHRWNEILKPEINRSAWSPKEDKFLLEAVGKYLGKWRDVGSLMGTGRTGKQCRERWYNFLNPKLKKGKWEKQEDLKLFKIGYEFKGKGEFLLSKYIKLASELIERNQQSIKARFISLLKKYTDHQSFQSTETLITNIQITFAELKKRTRTRTRTRKTPKIKHENRPHNHYKRKTSKSIFQIQKESIRETSENTEKLVENHQNMVSMSRKRKYRSKIKRNQKEKPKVSVGEMDEQLRGENEEMKSNRLRKLEVERKESYHAPQINIPNENITRNVKESVKVNNQVTNTEIKMKLLPPPPRLEEVIRYKESGNGMEEDAGLEVKDMESNIVRNSCRMSNNPREERIPRTISHSPLTPFYIPLQAFNYPQYPSYISPMSPMSPISPTSFFNLQPHSHILTNYYIQNGQYLNQHNPYNQSARNQYPSANQ